MTSLDLRKSFHIFSKKLLGLLPTVAADTIALFLYSASGAVLTIVYEVFFLKLSGKQWAGIRVVFNVLRFIGARLCGKITDQVRARLQGDSKHPFRLAIAGAISLSLYQLPVYALSARVCGAEFGQIKKAVVVYFLDNLVFGWMYILILDWVRRRMVVTTEPT